MSSNSEDIFAEFELPSISDTNLYDGGLLAPFSSNGTSTHASQSESSMGVAVNATTSAMDTLPDSDLNFMLDDSSGLAAASSAAPISDIASNLNELMAFAESQSHSQSHQSTSSSSDSAPEVKETKEAKEVKESKEAAENLYPDKRNWVPAHEIFPDKKVIIQDFIKIFFQIEKNVLSLCSSHYEALLFCSGFSDSDLQEIVQGVLNNSDCCEIVFDLYHKDHEEVIASFFKILCDKLINVPKINKLNFGQCSFENILFFEKLMSIFFASFSKQCHLQTLEFYSPSNSSESVQLTEASYRQFSEFLSSNNTIICLEFGVINFSGAGLLSAHWISRNATIQSLMYEFLGNEEFRAICDALKKNKTVQTLSISNIVPLSPNTLYAFKSLIASNSKITTLDILNFTLESTIEESGAYELFEGFKKNRGLKHLTLPYQLGEHHFKKMLEVIDPDNNHPLSKNLVSLKYSSGGHEDEDEDEVNLHHSNINKILDVIQKSQILEKLDLSENGLYFKGKNEAGYYKDHVLVRLFEVPVVRHRLTWLDISDNFLGDEHFNYPGFPSLCNLIQSKECRIQYLNISNNRVSCAEFSNFFNALDLNSSITQLYFENANLNNSDLEKICIFFESQINVTLRTLVLDDEREGFNDAKVYIRLFNALKYNRTLECLSLGQLCVLRGQNKLEKAIINMLKTNRSLSELNFDNIDSNQWGKMNHFSPRFIPKYFKGTLSNKVSWEYHQKLLDLEESFAKLRRDVAWNKTEAQERMPHYSTNQLYHQIYKMRRLINHAKIAKSLKRNSKPYKELRRMKIFDAFASMYGSTQFNNRNINIIIFDYVGCWEKAPKPFEDVCIDMMECSQKDTNSDYEFQESLDQNDQSKQKQQNAGLTIVGSTQTSKKRKNPSDSTEAFRMDTGEPNGNPAVIFSIGLSHSSHGLQGAGVSHAANASSINSTSMNITSDQSSNSTISHSLLNLEGSEPSAKKFKVAN